MPDTAPVPLKALTLGAGRPAAKATLSDFHGVEDLFGPLDADAGPARISARTAWSHQGWLRRCVDVRASTLAGLPWAVYRRGEREAGEPLLSSDLAEWPEDFAALHEVESALYLTEAALALEGQAYLRKLRTAGAAPRSPLGRFGGMQWLSPVTVKPKLTPSGVAYYEREVNHRRVQIPAEQVVAVYQPDPYVEVGPGSSDGQAARIGATVLDALAQFEAGYLQRGAIKGTLLTVEGHILAEEKQRLESWWQRWFSGTRGAGSQKVINADAVKPVVVGEGLSDLANVALTKEQREAVATGLGVPHSLVLSNAANFATAQTDLVAFYLTKVVPQAKLIERAWNRQLFAPLGLTFSIEWEKAEVMQAYELEKAEKVRALVGVVLTEDEARALLNHRRLGQRLASGALQPKPSPSTGSPSTGDEAERAPGIGERVKAILEAGY